MTEEPGEYLAGRIERALAADPRTSELGVRAELEDDLVVLRGEVTAAERRAAIEQVVREVVPGCGLRNEVSVAELRPPGPGEPISAQEPRS